MYLEDDIRYTLNFVLADYYSYLDEDMIYSIVEEVMNRLKKGDYSSSAVSPPCEKPLLSKEFNLW